MPRIQLLTCLLYATIATTTLAADSTDFSTGALRCEQLRNPQGVDQPTPRLSWNLLSDQRGARQTAYQILVASSPTQLDAEQADLWDSGRIESDDCILIEYQGKPLKSHQHCYWKVRAWNHNNQASEWSKPADWLMGQLQPDDWTGDWIGIEVPKKLEYLAQTNWIWHDEGDPAVVAQPGKVYFRREFTVPSVAKIERAIYRITADNSVKIYLNGRDLGSRGGPNSTKELDVTHRLLPGKNVLAAVATNDGPQPTSAGLIAWLQIRFASGEPLVVISDRQWKSSTTEQEEWHSSNFDDTNWGQAKLLGPVGMKPWGPVRHAEDRRLPARHLRKQFQSAKGIKRAVVSYSGLGLSELYINGQRIGDQVLSPAMTEYPQRLPYVTRDVTTAIKQGENTIGVILGNGRFYSPRSEVYAAMPTFGSPMLNLRLQLEHEDGTHSEVTSDDTWRITDDGPIVANNEYDGEDYDARKELTGWSEPGYNDLSWQMAEVLTAPLATMSAEAIDPIRVTQTLKARSVKEVEPGVFVYDLGQNIVGWCRLKASGPAGTTIRLRHAETLNADGSLALANIRTAQATDNYTLKGEGEEFWQPRFTYHGFRYVEITGYPGTPPLDAVQGCVVHDDLAKVGQFECSNPLLNQIYENVVWGFRGNYRSVPTDCPQRDERQGWLGDRLEVARGESYVYDVAAFYTKWLRDIRDSQQPSGSLPDVAPAHWPTYSDNVVWPSAAVLLPQIIAEQYGDTGPIRQQYESSKRWIEYMNEFVNAGLISRDSYGDWCVPPEDPLLIHSADPARKTNTTLLASAFFAYDLQLMHDYAKQLNHPTDARWFADRAKQVRDAVNDEFFNREAGQYDNGTQTSSVLPLAFDLVPPQEHIAVANCLAENVSKTNSGHIATGLVGGQFLLKTLTGIGRADLAYEIAAQKEYPSWGYMASQGATTIWELWNGDTADPAMNSGNHVMLVGDLLTWLYEDLAGIAPDAAKPGFKHIVMRPHPVAGLNFVKASHRCPYGWIRSEWRKQGGNLTWHLTIPPNTTATLYVPATSAEQISEAGTPLAQVNGLRVLEAQDQRVVINSESGTYKFSVRAD